MKLPSLFGGLGRDKDTSVVRAEAQDQAEKLLVESFRLLSQVCSKMADFVETQRLTRQGFEEQGKFLERLDLRADSKGSETK